MEVPSVEVSVEACMEASVEVSSAEASVEALMEASMKAFMEDFTTCKRGNFRRRFHNSMEASITSIKFFMEAIKASMEVHGSLHIFHGSFHGSFHELPPKIQIVQVAHTPEDDKKYI